MLIQLARVRAYLDENYPFDFVDVEIESPIPGAPPTRSQLVLESTYDVRGGGDEVEVRFTRVDLLSPGFDLRGHKITLTYNDRGGTEREVSGSVVGPGRMQGRFQKPTARHSI